jgi:hypothetical protein
LAPVTMILSLYFFLSRTVFLSPENLLKPSLNQMSQSVPLPLTLNSYFSTDILVRFVLLTAWNLWRDFVANREISFLYPQKIIYTAI